MIYLLYLSNGTIQTKYYSNVIFQLLCGVLISQDFSFYDEIDLIISWDKIT